MTAVQHVVAALLAVKQASAGHQLNPSRVVLYHTQAIGERNTLNTATGCLKGVNPVGRIGKWRKLRTRAVKDIAEKRTVRIVT